MAYWLEKCHLSPCGLMGRLCQVKVSQPPWTGLDGFDLTPWIEWIFWFINKLCLLFDMHYTRLGWRCPWQIGWGDYTWQWEQAIKNDVRCSISTNQQSHYVQNNKAQIGDSSLKMALQRWELGLCTVLEVEMTWLKVCDVSSRWAKTLT